MLLKNASDTLLQLTHNVTIGLSILGWTCGGQTGRVDPSDANLRKPCDLLTGRTRTPVARRPMPGNRTVFKYTSPLAAQQLPFTRNQLLRLSDTRHEFVGEQPYLQRRVSSCQTGSRLRPFLPRKTPTCKRMHL